jgi:hypothetical protein
MHTKKEGRKMIGLPNITGAALDMQMARINRERKKLNKEPLTRVDIVCDAILNYTVQMGVDK